MLATMGGSLRFYVHPEEVGGCFETHPCLNLRSCQADSFLRSIYINVYIYIYMYSYICVYIYIYRDRYVHTPAVHSPDIFIRLPNISLV